LKIHPADDQIMGFKGRWFLQISGIVYCLLLYIQLLTVNVNASVLYHVTVHYMINLRGVCRKIHIGLTIETVATDNTCK